MRVHSVTVCPDRIDVIVHVDPSETLRTSQSAAAADRALGVLPGLARPQALD